jgi:glycosyltransferase involved in cell wall biosynthesis
MSRRPLRILTFSTLYPSSTRPSHGIFVETRLRKLLGSGEVEAVVVAPVPWFPSTDPRYGEYAAIAATPRHEARNGIEVHHPRYMLIPKFGMTISPFSLAAGALGTVRRLIADGFDFDLIDAHYFYPDGVAAAMLAAAVDKPFACTARGSDITQLPDYRLPRRMIHWASGRAAARIGVCKALCDEMDALGLPGTRPVTLRNGVDLERFVPLDRDECRRKLGLGDGEIILSVGHLIDRKGHHHTIEALASLPGTTLLLIGDGERREALMALGQRCGVADRVRFLGRIAQEDLKTYFSAADLTVLASSREGWANVLLESMACGTPVVASDVWGTPEVVAGPEAGVLMKELSPKGVADAVIELRRAYPSRESTRAYAERFSWDPTTNGQIGLFREILAART